MDSIWSFMDILILACGVYALYSAYILKTQGKIIQTFLLARDTKPEDCKDLPGYASAMSPKLYVMGGVMVAYGVISLINTYMVEVNSLYWVFMIVMFGCLVWYAIAAKRASEKYF
ncbi:MAG: hypothetical protein LUC98_14135 [Lachnospiraceae bacterium]|nr:hypothetical protein [Lachnospiraceae bacterium]